MAKKLITKDQLAATVERVAANISEVAGAAAEAIEEMGSEMGGATANTAGTGGMVPAPAAGDQDKFLRGDGTWATPEGGGGTGGVEIADVSDAVISTKHGRAMLTWTDPTDLTLNGATLARWAGTLVVRKAGSAPANKDDGTIVVDSTSRNAYASTPYTDTGLTDGTTYYYRFFPHTTGGTYTTGTSVNGTPDKEALQVPTAVGQLTYTGSYQTQGLSGYDDTKMTRTGDVGGTNAGTYTMNFTPLEDYKWSDGTTTAKSVTFTIERQTITNVPSQSGTLTYNGSTKAPTWQDYNSTKMTLGGTTSGTNAGNYTAIFTPDSNYKWSDGTTTAKNVTWTIGKAAGSVTLSKQSISLDNNTMTDTFTVTRSGDGAISVSSSDSTIATATLSGSTVTVNAVASGNVTVTVSVAAGTNYETTSTTVEVSVSTKQKVAVPTVTNTTTTYVLGSSKKPTVGPYDSTIITVTNTAQTDAGTYYVTFALNDTTAYEWEDGTTADKQVEWVINKANPTIYTNASNVQLYQDLQTKTVFVSDYSNFVSGTPYTAVPSDSSIATTSVQGRNLVITAVATGTTTITITLAETKNYKSGTKEITVSVDLSMISLNGHTWAEISAIAQAGEGDLYFDIGDCKEITLNGKIGDYFTADNLTLCVFILDFNHRDNGIADNNIIFGGFKTALSNGNDVALVDSQLVDSQQGNTLPTSGAKAFSMNHCYDGSDNGTNYGGWKGSDLRYDILGATSTPPSEYNQLKTTANVGYDATASTLTNPVADTFLAALPSDLRSVIRLWDRWIDSIGNKSKIDANIQKTTDAISLLAEKEIFGSTTSRKANYNEQNHQAQMRYYLNGNFTKKYKHTATSSIVSWFECSPSCSSAFYFCFVNVNGQCSHANAARSYGLAPTFKV